MSFSKNHTKKAVKERGEIFTPESLVEEMLNKLPSEYFNSGEKTILDNSCGSGNFLVKVLEYRMKNGVSHSRSLETIYGIELDFENAKECRDRLSLGKTDSHVWEILNNNIVCADALNPKHDGWKNIGYMWENKKSNDGFFNFDN